ncbi:MAG: ATP-binding cassette domain-containing protein, partial [Anaerolineae bacterium]|nr:ATP-binding cassette domain-containing protein [Anaerolineae bacterium]
MGNKDSTVELKNVTKSYTEGKTARTILENVNATFHPGEFVLILGTSGSGKSTLRSRSWAG